MNKKYVYGVLAVALAGGALACSGGGNDRNDARPANAVNAPVETGSPEPTKAGTIGDGMWTVGTDIRPGKYRSGGATEGMVRFCNWSVSKDDEILDIGATEKVSDQQLVTLKKGQQFETDGCGVWQKY